MKKCVDCESEEIHERKRCKNCFITYNRLRVKKYYKSDKIRYGLVKCSICGEDLIKSRPEQTNHGRCRFTYKNVSNYNAVKRSKSGNMVGRQQVINLGFSLIKSLHIHHIDENPNNNKLGNLMIMSDSNHAKLHQFLRKERSLLEKSSNSNLENCWNTLRDQLTTTWLEITSVNVIKIIDIGQSAAEPLNKDNIYIFK